MGNAISSGAKYCTSFLVGKAKYILQLEDNLDALESDVQLLEARRIDLEKRIKLEERKGLQRLQEVLVWLLRVEAIQSQVRDLLDAKTIEVERLSMCGYCSNDLILTYTYGKKVSQNLEKVNSFLSSKAFEVVAMADLPPDMEEGTSQSTTSMPSDVEKDPSQSTTSPLSDIEVDTSQSTTCLPSNMEEDPSQSTTGLSSDIEEDPSQAKYIMELEYNLEALQSVVQLIEARRIDLENIIKLEERKGLQQRQEVLVWLLRVEAIQSQVHDLLDAKTVEVERLSMSGYCSNDFILTYRYGKNVSENLEKAKDFLSSKDFEVVATEGLPPDMEEDRSQFTTGLPSNIEEDSSQSTIGLSPNPNMDESSQSTTGLSPNTEEESSQFTTGLPSNIMEEPIESTIGMSPNPNIDESFLSTNGLSPNTEDEPSQFTTGLPSHMEEGPSQSVTDLASNMDESSQFITGMSADTEEGPSQSITGMPPDMEEGNMLEATWKRLMEDKIGTLGLYGMGGIGKTTLLKQIEKKFLGKKDEFDEVISVVVTKDLQIGRIQKEIGKRLGLCDSEWEQKTKEEKASDIKVLLTRKRFAILLDDIWGKVELEEIGIPLPSPGNKSKVVYTTRSRKVCGRMGPDDMEVKCLGPENAWNLFRKKVRASTLESDPEILELAKIVCGKCNGLPLALNIIGKTMACKTTIQEWQRAIDVLTSNAAGYPEFKEEIFKVLKHSYDYLEDVIVQQCLVYCALFPEESRIEKDRLVDYWIYEGIINGGGPLEKAVDKGYEIIGILVSACLLLNHESSHESGGEGVIMHDVIRQMALWIASNYGEEKESFVVKTCAGLHQMPEVENWNAVRKISLENNEIETISVIQECPNLTTLILRKNKLVSICFLSMPKLAVLDLSWNKDLSKLPEDVSKLVSLRYLGLAGTKLEELPMGLSELIQLRHLDINNMKNLQSISVISRLLNLETLNVFGSIPLSLESIEDLKLLKNLKLFSVTITELSVLGCFLSIPRLASCTQDLEINLGEFEAENIPLAATATSVRSLLIQGGSVLHLMEEMRYGRGSVSFLMDDTRYGCRSPSTVSFQNLKSVLLGGVSGIQDLTWLLFAPSLTVLSLNGLSELREIISKEKVSRNINEASSIVPFQKLCSLFLFELVELTSIYWQPLVFPDLTSIIVLGCPKLTKLPLNKESSKGNDLQLLSKEKKWLDGLEWEDEEIKHRLLHMDQVTFSPSSSFSCSIM